MRAVWPVLAIVAAAACSAGHGSSSAPEGGPPASDDGGLPDSGATDAGTPTPLGTTLATIVVSDTSGGGTDRSNVPVTFGEPFAPGDVPAGATVAARVDGAGVPLQVDAKATHGDGSLRHAVLTAILPTLPGGGAAHVELVATRSPAPSGPAPTASALLATTFDAVVSAHVGTTDVQASARKLLGADSSHTWLQGPLVIEWSLSAPLAANDGSVHPLLSARFEVRAYAGMKTALVSVTVENDWAYPSAPQNVTYDAAIVSDRGPVWSEAQLTHFSQARWRKTFVWGADPQVAVAHDVHYLMSTGSLPNFDPAVTAADTALASLQTALSGNTAPMQIGLATAYMPTTGGRGDIGPLPSWASLYVVSQDARAKAATLATGDAAGTWQIHYRDQSTGRPVSLDDHPYMTLLGNPGDAVNPQTDKSDAFPSCAGDCSSPNTPDSAHQPSLAYVPYLLTGDFYYLEELEFWANWNMLQANPAYRQHEKGLVQWDQPRGQAWSMRTLGEAAYVAPDADPMKAYFVSRVGTNLGWYNAQYTNSAQANPFGYITNGSTLGSDGTLAPWMDDFFTWSIGFLADLGFANAAPLRDWKSKFPVSLMTDPGYCWIFASVYHLSVEDSTSHAFYPSWSAVYSQTLQANGMSAVASLPCGGPAMASALMLQPGEMVGYADSAEGYPSNLQIALAIAAESKAPGGKQAWSVFSGRSVKPDYSAEPQFALVPRP